ncbi:oligosaccharide flippase family protein [Halomonas sp. 18H]|nr:oligosaccharide flippase family protein [Halomonas sp. 18H]MCW4153898.1 oligosaccharide flippase family protein [Halomonas sp. 18H]
MSTDKLALVAKLRGHLKGGGLKGQMLRGGISSIAVKITNTGLAFLLAVLLARALGPEGYGIYSFAFALVTVMAIPSQLGLPQLVIRETAKAQVNEQWGLLRGLWRWSSLAVWGFSSLIALAGLTGIWVFGDGMGDNQRLTILASLLLVPLVALGNLRGAALKGLYRVVLGQLPESVLRPATLMILVGIVWWFTAGVSPVVAMGLHVLAAVIAFIIGAVLLWCVRPSGLQVAPTPVYQSLEWLSSALPLAMIAGFQVINNQADIIMLGLFRTSEEVGVYKVVVSVSSLVIFGLQAVNMVVAPHFARLYAQSDIERLQQVVTISSRAILALALPTVLVFILFGDWLLTFVFGEEYSSGYEALIILASGQLMNAVFGSVGFLLSMTNYEKLALSAVTVAAIVNMFLNALLIPIFGISGAALSTAITLITWNSFMWVATRKKLGVNASGLRFF